MLYDHRGKRVNHSKLHKVESEAGLTSVRRPYDQVVAKGLTPKKLQSIMERAQNNDGDDYLVLAGEMERRDCHYFSVLSIRKQAVAELPRNMLAASSSQEDQDIAAACRGLVETELFDALLPDMLDALGKGFSVCEITWDRDTNPHQWEPKAYDWRNPRWFSFDQATGKELLLRHDSSDIMVNLSRGTDAGRPLAPFKYLVHTPKVISGLPLLGGLARQVAAMHLFKSFAVRDWMAFAEVFGMPIRIGKYNSGATAEDIETLKTAVQNIGSDSAAVFPETMKIEFERQAMSGSAGADEFYKVLVEWNNGEISKAVLGQMMKSESGSTLAAAKVDGEVRADIRNADARQLAATINRDLIRPFVDLNFGPRGHVSKYPKFQLDTDEPEDLAVLASALPVFIDRGLEVSKHEILSRFNFKTKEELPEDTEFLEPRTLSYEGVDSGDEGGKDQDHNPGSTGKGKSGGEGAAESHLNNKLVLDILNEVNTGTNLRRVKARIKELLK